MAMCGHKARLLDDSHLKLQSKLAIHPPPDMAVDRGTLQRSEADRLN